MWTPLLLVLLPLAFAQDWVTTGCGQSKYDDAGTPGSRLPTQRGGPAGHIENGYDARQGEFPWMCELRYLGSLACGAVIISSRWVITAAHCVEGVSPNTLGIVVGQHSRSADDGTLHAVESFTMHPEYDLTGDIENDIAVVRLSVAIEWSEDIVPACRPEGDYEVDLAITSGWGGLYTGGPLADVLLFATEPIMNQEVCDRGCFNPSWDMTGMVCYGSCDGSHNQGMCSGDSGSPLIVEDSDGAFDVVGVVSWGISGACVQRYPSVFTNVSYFNEWVDETAIPLD